MGRKNYLFTSESVSEGHPDKVCDRISDEIVDLFYREALEQGFDPWQVRVACETLATTNYVVIAGETRVPASVTKAKIEKAASDGIAAFGRLDAVVAALRTAEPQREGAWRIELPHTPDAPIQARYYQPVETRDRGFAPLMLTLSPKLTLPISVAIDHVHDLAYPLVERTGRPLRL